MIVVRVICDRCGTVDIDPGDVTLDRHQNVYRFDCPTCDTACLRPTNARIDAVLTNLGCPTVLGPITEAEIERFVAALNQ